MAILFKRLAILLLAFFSARSMKCNGAAEFCDLPFHKFTFPGTHNAGAFKLEEPKDLKKIPLPGKLKSDAKKCYFDNQDLDYLEQLASGVRWFNFDMCSRASGEANTSYNCHSASGTSESWMGHGESLNDTLVKVKAWLQDNAGEVVVFRPDDTDTSFDANNAWEELVGNVFNGGEKCVRMNTNYRNTLVPPSSGPDDVRCGFLAWGNQFEGITLGSLVESNVRFLTFVANEWAFLNSTWTGDYSGMDAKGLKEHLLDWAESAAPRAPKCIEGRPCMGHTFSVFTGIKAFPDFSKLEQCSSSWCKVKTSLKEAVDTDMTCNSYRAGEKINAKFLQDDSVEPSISPWICNATCSKCPAYRSPIEVAHQNLLDKDQHIIAVIADYITRGDNVNLTQLTHRMNQANVRRLNGTPEVVCEDSEGSEGSDYVWVGEGHRPMLGLAMLVVLTAAVYV